MGRNCECASATLAGCAAQTPTDRIDSTACGMTECRQHRVCLEHRTPAMPDAASAKALHDALGVRFGENLAVDDNLAGLDTLARLAARRVHRRYLDKPVEPELLRLLCACALSAPSKSDL